MPQSQWNCPVWATLVSIVLVFLRMLIPDLVAAGQWAASKAAAHVNSRASQELAALRAELAQLKQR